jgi:hypothetical protein
MLFRMASGIYTNGAEEFFSRTRRAEIGHHHLCGQLPDPLCPGRAWRENHRRVANGTQVKAVVTLAMTAPTSMDWCRSAAGG